MRNEVVLDLNCSVILGESVEVLIHVEIAHTVAAPDAVEHAEDEGSSVIEKRGLVQGCQVDVGRREIEEVREEGVDISTVEGDVEYCLSCSIINFQDVDASLIEGNGEIDEEALLNVLRSGVAINLVLDEGLAGSLQDDCIIQLDTSRTDNLGDSSSRHSIRNGCESTAALDYGVVVEGSIEDDVVGS